MARKKGQKRPTGQMIFVILGLLVTISMATSYICSIVSPSPPTPTPTPTTIIMRTPTPTVALSLSPTP